MHILEGTITPEVCLGAGVVSLAAVGYSLRQMKDSLADRMVPLTGMMGALIFAGQMVNFPIALLGIPAVSGHLIGGVLAASILGPWAGCLAITLVLIVQCFLFSDGGLLALSVNVLNMGVIGSWGGYAVYSVVRKLLGDGPRGILVGAVIASWLSVQAASAMFCLEFALSYRAVEEFSMLNLVALMMTVHSAIGVGEALITGTVISFVLAQRPDLIYRGANSDSKSRLLAPAVRFVTAGVVCAFAIAAFVAPFASEFDDGLVAVSKQVGIDKLEVERVMLFSDYDQVVPGWQRWSVSLAGLLGTTAVLVIAFLLERSLRLRLAPVKVSHDKLS